MHRLQVFLLGSYEFYKNDCYKFSQLKLTSNKKFPQPDEADDSSTADGANRLVPARGGLVLAIRGRLPEIFPCQRKRRRIGRRRAPFRWKLFDASSAFLRLGRDGRGR